MSDICPRINLLPEHVDCIKYNCFPAIILFCKLLEQSFDRSFGLTARDGNYSEIIGKCDKLVDYT